MRSDSDGTKPAEQTYTEASGEVGYLLFDSLVHHLIEKGVLTKNDALSVVQTAAQVVRGRMEEDDLTSTQTRAAMTILGRTYSIFEALRERTGSSQLDGHNIHALRPPLHGDRPKFPSDD
jgi:hypothetical protein